MSIPPSPAMGLSGVSDGSPSGAASNKNYSRTPTSWDAEDDVLLMHLKDQQNLGWKAIASHFDNRTPNACQFRWRRLKSGNLKNPPKSATALGSTIGSKPSTPTVKKTNSNSSLSKKSTSPPNLSGFPSYSPISNATFTGYDNNITNALAGLNALSNSPSHIPAATPPYSGNPTSTSDAKSPLHNPPIQTTNHPHNFDKSPKLEVSLDPQAHTPIPISGGGYYADISIDPTMNLPHNQPPNHSNHTSGDITPRNSTSNGSNNTGGAMHNNSIIQIVRDDRTSVSSTTRASVSSLPSNSMNIPHHQLHTNTLAHLPILFGSNGSISGPSRNSSLSGAAGIVSQASVPSLRNGSIGKDRNSISGPPSAAYLRSASVVIPHDRKDEYDKIKFDKKYNISSSKSKSKKIKKKLKAKKPITSKLKKKSKTHKLVIPWSMEEDELLINRRNRELSFAELSILLPQRTEGEIWSRIDYLEKLRNGHRASRDLHRRRRESSIGLVDVDDFYDDDDDDDMIGGIGVSDDEDVNDRHDSIHEEVEEAEEEEEEEEEDDDDDEDDDEEDDEEDDDDEEEDNEEAIDDEDAERSMEEIRKRKRRASSAVNPLSRGK